MIEIKFYFPDIQKTKMVDVPADVLEMIKNDKLNRLMGFYNDEQFVQDYAWKIGKNKNKFVNIKETQLKSIQKAILEFTRKIQKELGSKSTDVRYFVTPWFPTELESKKFEGVNAQAPYYGTVHLNIDLKSFTNKGLEKTLAHELNHLRYFENFKDLNFTIKDFLIAEGLAETFREDFVGGKPAAWSKALNKKQIEKALEKMQPIILSRDRKVYEEIFFGSKNYKRWTGYSVGYYLVKNYLKKNKKMSWMEIMKMDINKFF